MSQRLLITIVAIGVVLAVGLSTLVSWGVTSSMIASATIAGPAGADGKDGAPGPQGIPGADGRDGADGAPGTAAAGRQGPAGTPGADGEDATSTPPVTYSRAADAANLTWDENTPVGTISLPAGTYTISYTMSGVSAALISGATGNGFEPATCGLSDGGTPTHTDEAYVGGGSVDFARTQIVTTTQATTFAITCTTIGGPGWGVVVEVSWSELTLTAARLD